MNSQKNALQSKTVWGALLAGICSGLSIFGVVDVTAAEQQTILDSIESLVVIGGQLGGAVLAIYGRITARHSIKYWSRSDR